MTEQTKKMMLQHLQIQCLPDDVAVRVLSELPAKTLLRFKSVCKHWYSLISDPYFIKVHVSRTIQNENSSFALIQDPKTNRIYSFHLKHHDYEVEASSSSLPSPLIELNEVPLPQNSHDCHNNISSSCNGLMLLICTIRHRLALWNPTTGEFKQLPPSMYYRANKARGFFDGVRPISTFELGYDLKNDDYKVIGIYHGYDENTEEQECMIAVYSLRSNSWKSIMRIQGVDECSYYVFSFGKYLNGAIHWLSSDYEKIVSFDFGSEKWNEVELPDECQGKFYILNSFGGRLCIVRSGPNTMALEIFEMRVYGVKESWRKILSVSDTTLAAAAIKSSVSLSEIWGWDCLGILKKGNFLLVGSSISGKRLIFYNPSKGSVAVAEFNISDTNLEQKKMIGRSIGSILVGLSGFETYIGSLVELKSNRHT